jgi:hypothetical protein
MGTENLKIYVHNFFSDNLFTRLAMNTHNRIYSINKELKGKVLCEYKNIKLELIFDPTIHDKNDGFHYIDLFSIYKNKNDYDTFKDIDDSYENWYDGNTYHIANMFQQRLYELIKDKKNWIIFFMTGEKEFYKIENLPYRWFFEEKDEIYAKFKNHKIITDNVFINDAIENQYSNIFFCLTNSIFFWNNLAGIRYFYEFKNIYDKINFEYDLMFSVRNLRDHRIQLLLKLSKLNKKNILLQYTDSTVKEFVKDEQKEIQSITNKDMLWQYEYKDIFKNLNNSGINLNTQIGTKDFENLEYAHWYGNMGLDLFFRILPKAKMQILDETWAWASWIEFNSCYLSEKTWGYILAGIPFISTHSYPLDLLEKIFKLEKHPFYNEIKEYKNDKTKFVEFINLFLLDFDANYKKCKDWTDLYHNALIEKINNENSLLELFINGFKKDITLIQKKLL